VQKRIVFALATVAGFAALFMLISRPTRSEPQQNQAGAVVESRGVHVPVPVGWTCNTALLAQAGPINLTNFGGAYLRGGILPPGGAEIDITNAPAVASVQDLIRNELRGVTLDPLRPFSDNGKTGIQAAYTFDVQGVVERNVAVYIPQGSALYKFYLSYWTGDRNEAALLGTLSQVVREAQLR
jgi:hypothetical protein